MQVSQLVCLTETRKGTRLNDDHTASGRIVEARLDARLYLGHASGQNASITLPLQSCELALIYACNAQGNKNISSIPKHPMYRTFTKLLHYHIQGIVHWYLARATKNEGGYATAKVIIHNAIKLRVKSIDTSSINTSIAPKVFLDLCTSPRHSHCRALKACFLSCQAPQSDSPASYPIFPHLGGC